MVILSKLCQNLRCKTKTWYTDIYTNLNILWSNKQKLEEYLEWNFILFKIYILEALILVLQDMILFGYKIHKEVNMIFKMITRVLLHNDWCFHKKMRVGNRGDIRHREMSWQTSSQKATIWKPRKKPTLYPPSFPASSLQNWEFWLATQCYCVPVRLRKWM